MRYGQTEPGPPSIVSTVKINQAGFTEMMDTEVMFRKWFSQARKSRLLPQRVPQKWIAISRLDQTTRKSTGLALL